MGEEKVIELTIKMSVALNFKAKTKWASSLKDTLCQNIHKKKCILMPIEENESVLLFSRIHQTYKEKNFKSLNGFSIVPSRRWGGLSLNSLGSELLQY